MVLILSPSLADRQVVLSSEQLLVCQQEAEPMEEMGNVSWTEAEGEELNQGIRLKIQHPKVRTDTPNSIDTCWTNLLLTALTLRQYTRLPGMPGETTWRLWCQITRATCKCSFTRWAEDGARTHSGRTRVWFSVFLFTQCGLTCSWLHSALSGSTTLLNRKWPKSCRPTPSGSPAWPFTLGVTRSTTNLRPCSLCFSRSNIKEGFWCVNPAQLVLLSHFRSVLQKLDVRSGSANFCGINDTTRQIEVWTKMERTT